MKTLFRTTTYGSSILKFKVISFNKSYYVLLKHGIEKPFKRVTCRFIYHDTYNAADDYLTGRAQANIKLLEDTLYTLTRNRRLYE